MPPRRSASRPGAHRRRSSLTRRACGSSGSSRMHPRVRSHEHVCEGIKPAAKRLADALGVDFGFYEIDTAGKIVPVEPASAKAA